MKLSENSIPQNIILENRKKLSISGVKDIDCFTENKVILNTHLGELVIKGIDLHIIALETETGDFSMTGEIASMTYNTFSSNANIFRRLFR